MKIATFNVNGVNGRLPRLVEWLEEAQPDVVCLQELKAPQDKFPAEAISKAGYGAIWQGQSRWNGVAILARGWDPVETRRGLPGEPADEQARYIEAAVNGVLIGCLYLPNGNPRPGPKFDYKLAWFERLIAHAAGLLKSELPVVLAGDYNLSRPISTSTIRDPGERTLSSSPKAATLIAASSGRAGPTPFGTSIRASRSTPSGIISGTRGAGMRAFASTTSCSARPPRRVWLRLVSTARSAAAKVPATTPLLGWC